MNLIEEIENNRVLMKNNMLVKARYSLSLVENRIFLFMLYNLQKKSDGILTCSISHSEFRDIVKFKEKNTVKGILEILEELRRKPIYFREEKINKKGNVWGAYGFINGYEYDDELGTFYIEASEKIHNMLKEYLKMGYTPINVQIWLSLNNSYSQRFYDLLRLWSGTKEVINYKIEEIKELLMLDDKYSKYNDFKKRVVLPAITELNETGYFDIYIKENKIGRKVDSIDFYVKDLDKRKYFTKEVAITKNTKKATELEVKSTYMQSLKCDIATDFEDTVVESEFYIPNKKLFTPKTLEAFKDDFKGYNFSEGSLKKFLQESITATLDKDDEDKIKVRSYKYFKATLTNKIKDARETPKMSTKGVKTRYHNINQTFTKYTPEELERILLANQKDKF
ncbi:MAG: RepB family plasmid replication initiator protein [Romboutsia sp.]